MLQDFNLGYKKQQLLKQKTFLKPELSEVVGKTRRLSSTKKVLKLKLGLTNKTPFFLFNIFLLFYKKKQICKLFPYQHFLSTRIKSTYSRNGLFTNNGIRIVRVGKLSTFR